MEKIYLITIDEVYDYEVFDHEPLAYKNPEDAFKKFEEVKEEIRSNYEREIEGGWEIEDSKTHLELYNEGYYASFHIVASLQEIEVK